MRSTTAYFAGVGTVVVAIAAGLGGGLLLGDIMSPQGSKQAESARLEQRTSSQPIPATDGNAQPVPYMAANQIANTVGEQAAPAQQPQQPQSQQPQQQAQPQAPSQQAQPQLQQASTQPVQPPKQQPERSAAPQPVTAAAQPSAPAEQSVARAAPEDSLAKAREADLKREARRADDKRKAERRQQWNDDRRLQWDERRQQWVEKRKWRQRGDDDLRDVEASVREETERRPFFGRETRFEPREPRFGSREPGFFGSREPDFGGGRFTVFED